MEQIWLEVYHFPNHARKGRSDALAIPIWVGDKLADRLAGLLTPLTESARDVVLGAAESQGFEGEAGAFVELFVEDEGQVRRLLLVGAGSDRDDAAFERIGGNLVARLLTVERQLIVEASGLGLGPSAIASFARGARLRAWRYDVYRTKLPPKQTPKLSQIRISGIPDEHGTESQPGPIQEAMAAERAQVSGVYLARELVTEPANVIYPESFIARVREKLEGDSPDHGVEFEVLDEKAMAELGMGALLGVGQGSARPPRLFAIRWNGGKADAKPVVLIGKGITFDTGGISIKPALGMESMKWDMGGAAAVAGTLFALAERKAKVNVVGVCALAENMPDGNAQRPGDVVTSMSGQTIEVINTDAEGRLVLADAMTWAQRQYKPEVMIDLATLTGAMVISLGHEYGGMFSNDDGLAAKLEAAGKATGDKLWRLPMNDTYNKIMDSPIADMKNSASREGGAITAACFLGRFVEEGVKWAHLDIAGMAWSDKASHLYDKGATGYGVALLDRYIADNHEG